LPTDGSTSFAAVDDLAFIYTSSVGPSFSPAGALVASLNRASGEMVTVEWDNKLPPSPYGAATVTAILRGFTPQLDKLHDHVNPASPDGAFFT
jgi:hypothetical protein